MFTSHCQDNPFPGDSLHKSCVLWINSDGGSKAARRTHWKVCHISWRSELSWVTFHVSGTLICHCLLTAQFMEMTMRKSVFLWYWSQRDVHLFCKSRMAFTWTKNVVKSSCHNQYFLVIVRNELKHHRCLVQSYCLVDLVARCLLRDWETWVESRH